jgi:ketosteroid isomerase-like protein
MAETTEMTMDAEREITRLVARLVFEADEGALDDYLALFTDDAVWEVRPGPGSQVPASLCTGRDEISASVQQRRAYGVQGPGAGTMHHITTQHYDVTGDEATGRIYYQFVGMVDGVPTIRTLGEYRDRYRRTGDGWKLAERVVHIR